MHYSVNSIWIIISFLWEQTLTSSTAMKDDYVDYGMIYRLERTITLTPLKPNEYRSWDMQTRATFALHKCLGIVLGSEPNPTPTDDDGKVIGPIGKRLRKTINSWETRHVLRERHFSSLFNQQTLPRFHYVKTTSLQSERLNDEYGRRLDIEYIRINSELQSLRKTDDIIMNAHIACFNQLLQEVE